MVSANRTNSVDKSAPYPQSKAMAEKAVWEYLDRIKEEEKFDVSIINPGFILGPILGKEIQDF